MNNVKASNAVVAVADAMSSMTADYESQLAQLRAMNEAMKDAHRSMLNRQVETENVVQEVAGILRETLSKDAGKNEHSIESVRNEPEQACAYLLAKLSRAPCLMDRRSGSSGALSTSPASKVDTPSA